MDGKKLIDDIHKVVDIISDVPQNKYISVLTHYDADGLSAGGALLRTLAKTDKNFHIRAVTELNEKVIREFFKSKAYLHIITDLGSGELNLLDRLSKEYNLRNLIVIDHHKINGESTDITVVNPEIYNIDGGSADCASILSSLVGYYALEDPYFLEIGLVGATGDMQVFEPKDLTEYVLREGIKRDYVKVVKDFIFFQNKHLPIFKAIIWTFLPYIPGFSGRDDIGLRIVREAGIEVEKADGSYKTVNDLTDYERNKLLETILKYVLKSGVEDLKPQDLLQDVILFPHENHPLLSNSIDFSSLVNTAGRMGYDYLGILVAAGVRGEYVNDIESIYTDRRRLLAKYLSLVEKNLELYNDLLLIADLRGKDVNPRFAGTISTILSKSLLYQDKVVFVLLNDGLRIKISARAPKKLVSKGFDLSKIMNDLARKYGGHGGGHNVAAGASLEKDDDNLKRYILDLVNSYVTS